MLNSSGPIPSLDFAPADVTNMGIAPMVAPAVGLRITDIPTQTCFWYIAFNVSTIITQAPVNIAAPFPGMVSQTPMGPSKSLKGSMRCATQGQLNTRCGLDMSGNNGMIPNSVGITSPGNAQLGQPTG